MDQAELEELRRQEEQEELERKQKEAQYAQILKESRATKVPIITLPLVVRGIKFIIENQDKSQDELFNGLMSLGCNFTFEDIKNQFPMPVAEEIGLSQGSIAVAANIIANMRGSFFGRARGERFLAFDDNTSLYHFIRITTGDFSYTKEYIDSLKNNQTR